MAGRFAVVDLSNRFVRWATRAEIHGHQLVHRSVHVALFDAAGRLVVQRRHPRKLTYPDTWDLSACGHVEESDYLAGPDERLDEVYAAVAAREVEEELGVAPALTPCGAFAPVPAVHYEQIRLFVGRSDGPFVVQEEEVAEVRTVSRRELDDWLAGAARVTETLRYFTPRIPWPRG